MQTCNPAVVAVLSSEYCTLYYRWRKWAGLQLYLLVWSEKIRAILCRSIKSISWHCSSPKASHVISLLWLASLRLVELSNKLSKPSNDVIEGFYPTESNFPRLFLRPCHFLRIWSRSSWSQNKSNLFREIPSKFEWRFARTSTQWENDQTKVHP